MELIPAIDIIDGKCVRLTEGDYSQKKVYREDPLEVAKEFEAAGIRRLHLVDLDGAKASTVVNWKVLEKIAGQTNLLIDFGGGIKNDEAIHLAFNSGASQVTAGSIAAKEPKLVRNWLSEFGTEKIILGADVKNEMIAVNGWKETTALKLDDFLEDYRKDGMKYVVCTDISKDGKLQGPSFELYQKITENFPWYNLIASGGVRDMQDVQKLKEMNLYGVIIGKALYEGRITLKELSDYLK
jgi:phosphoribosylformimino-5-aminoimidazole carboxamide ribotide isomerase